MSAGWEPKIPKEVKSTALVSEPLPWQGPGVEAVVSDDLERLHGQTLNDLAVQAKRSPAGKPKETEETRFGSVPNLAWLRAGTRPSLCFHRPSPAHPVSWHREFPSCCSLVPNAFHISAA